MTLDVLCTRTIVYPYPTLVVLVPGTGYPAPTVISRLHFLYGYTVQYCTTRKDTVHKKITFSLFGSAAARAVAVEVHLNFSKTRTKLKHNIHRRTRINTRERYQATLRILRNLCLWTPWHPCRWGRQIGWAIARPRATTTRGRCTQPPRRHRRAIRSLRRRR